MIQKWPFLLFLLFFACSAPNKIRQNGLSYIELGSKMPNIRELDQAGFSARDTVFQDMDISDSSITKWRAIKVRYPSGAVYIESDFADKTRVGRIRIESANLYHKYGIRVGYTLGELMEITRSWEINPLKEFGYLEFYSPKFSNTVFLVKVKGYDFDNTPSPIEPRYLPFESIVELIVLL